VGFDDTGYEWKSDGAAHYRQHLQWQNLNPQLVVRRLDLLLVFNGKDKIKNYIKIEEYQHF
jgi:hypothetical protein